MIRLEQIENLNSIDELLQSLLSEEKLWLSESSATYRTTKTITNQSESYSRSPISFEAEPGYHFGQQYRNKLLENALYVEPELIFPDGFEASGITSIEAENGKTYLYIISDDPLATNLEENDHSERNDEPPSQLLRISQNGKPSPVYFTLPDTVKGESLEINGEAITYDINTSTLYILDEGNSKTTVHPESSVSESTRMVRSMKLMEHQT